MAYAKGPDQERFRWYSCVCGDYILPTSASDGAVVVDASSEQKVDAKKASGKDKAKTTKQGREPIKGSIDWEFTAFAWEDNENGKGVESVLEYLDPNGPNEGGPFDFAHPDTDRRGVKAIVVTKVSKVEWKGWHGKVKIDWTEWNPPDKKGNAGGGAATSTPIDPDKWTATNGQVKPQPWSDKQTAKQSSGGKGFADSLDRKQAPNAAP